MAVSVKALRNAIIDGLELSGTQQDYYRLNHSDIADLEELLKTWLEKNGIGVDTGNDP